MRVWIVGLITVVLASAGCGSGTGVVDTTSSTSSTDAPWSSFFFRQDPIVFDVPQPTFEQLEAFDHVSVPRGTTVLIPISRLEGSKADTAEIRIMDVMRGPASEQDIDVLLIDGDQWIASIRYGFPRSSCGNPILEALDIRGADVACRHPEEGWVAWTESGRNYKATVQTKSPADGLVAWVENLRAIELGNAGPPYEYTFCRSKLERCDLPGEWVLNATTPDPG